MAAVGRGFKGTGGRRDGRGEPGNGERKVYRTVHLFPRVIVYGKSSLMDTLRSCILLPGIVEAGIFYKDMDVAESYWRFIQSSIWLLSLSNLMPSECPLVGYK